MSPNKARRNAVVAIIAATALCMLSACATAPHAFSSDPLAIMGGDASWYAVVPVSGNKVLLEELAHNMDNPQSVKNVLNRTNRIYLSGTLLQDESSGLLPFKILATGSYPKSMASIAFSSSRGWQKQGAVFGSVWFKNGYFGAAIPRKGLVCMSDSALMPGMLENVQKPFLEPIAVDPLFRASVEQPDTDSQITVFISEASYFLQLILGSNITFAAQNILITASPDAGSKGEDYRVGVRITLADQRNARALATLFRIVLNVPIHIENNTLIVNEQKMTAKELAHKFYFLYL